ncbi:MAG: PAS domain-containing protein [Cyclobacteriaceae bacterium]|nr:PAS domain-containing protein [Cyclobacteriaceae bacterium HetDA_MAG_MS6]
MRKTILFFSIFHAAFICFSQIQLTEDERKFVEQHPVITLGADPAWEPYVIAQSDGELQGFEVEFLQRISEISGLNIQIQADTWNNVVAKAKAKEIDGLVTSSPQPARAPFFNFTKEYGTSYQAVYSRTTDINHFSSLEGFIGKRLGIQGSNQFVQDVLDPFPGIELVFYADGDKLLQALLAEEIDYILTGSELTYYLNENGISGVRLCYLVEEDQAPLVYSIRKDWPELVSIFNKALDQISVAERNSIMSKWLLNAVENSFLSPAQRQLLASIDTLHISALNNWEPIIFQDASDRANGLFADYFDLLASQMKKPVEFQYCDNRQMLIESLEKTDLAIMSGSLSGVPSTEALYSFPLALTTKNLHYSTEIQGFGAITVAVSKRNPDRAKLKSTYPDFQFVIVSSPVDGINKVENDEVDAFIGSLPVILYHLKRLGITDLKISGVTSKDVNMRLHSKNEMMVDLMNQFIRRIPQGEVQALTRNWYNEVETENSYDYRSLFQLAIALLVLLLWVFLWNRSLVRQIRKRKRFEQSLIENKANLKAVLENTNALVCSLDTNFKLTTFNKNYRNALRTMFDLKVEEGLNIVEALPEPAKHIWKDRFERCMSGEELSVKDRIHSDKVRYFETLLTPIRLHDKIIGISCHSIDVTELAYLSRHFVSLLKNSTDYFYTKDVDLRFISASQSFTKLMGIANWNDIVGKTDYDIYPIELAEKYEKVEQKVLSTGQGFYDLEEEFVTQSGEKIWISNTTEPIRNEEKKIVGLIGISHDITQRKKMEEDLRKSQANLLAQIENTTSFIYMLDADLKLVSFNSNYFELTKTLIGHEVHVGDALLPLVPERSKKTWRSRFDRALGGEQFTVTDTTIIDGQEKCYQTSFNPIKLDDQILGISCFAQDVTEVTSLNRNMIGMLEHVDDLIYIKDLEHRFVAASQSLADKHGLESWTDLIGKSDFDLFDKSYAQQFYEEERPIIEDGAIMDNKEDKHPDEDGKSRWLISNKRPIRNENGQVVGLVGVSHDITKRKQMEQELKVAKINAETANKAKSTFLANMSHEIRTPLNSIIGFSDLLEGILKNDLQRTYLNAINSSGKTLLALINDILDLSKIESEKLEIKPTRVKVSDLQQDLINMFALKASQKQIGFTVDVTNPISEYLKLDELRVKQILINLIGNAIKFTDQGSVNVELKVSQEQDGKFLFCMIVKDTGIGIKESMRADLFEKFTQDITHKKNQQRGGTGLGLAITKRLVELMGGNISFTSEVGKGTVFQADIANVDLEDEDMPPVVHSGTTPTVLVKFKPARVLIIDDVDYNRMYLTELFRETAVEAIEASDGAEALKVLEKEKVDLVMTDIRMPKIDGYQLVSILKEQSKTRDIPVVAVTASVFGETQEIKSLFDGVLYKPILANDLFYFIKQFLPHEIIKSSKELEPLNDQVILTGKVAEQAKDRLWGMWENLRDHQPLDAVMDFAEEVQQVGLGLDAQTLLIYGQRLAMLVEALDIAGMLDHLKSFETLFDRQDE